MPRIKGKVYEDDPFCPHGFDEACPTCDVIDEAEVLPSERRSKRAVIGQAKREVREVGMDEAEYRRWRDRMAPPVDDGARDNYGGW